MTTSTTSRLGALMSDLSKMTKDQLAADLARVQDQAEQLAEVDRRRDADARAIDTCAKALDSLVAASRNGRSSSYDFPFTRSGPPEVDRVLAYLRLRYGIADPSGERDALRSELERTRRELDSLRGRFEQVMSAMQA